MGEDKIMRDHRQNWDLKNKDKMLYIIMTHTN